MSNNLVISSSKEILETMDNCTKCGICYSFCPVANVTNEFPGPKYTGPQSQRFRSIEFLEELSPDLCNGCGICTSVCPNEVAITDIITLAKSNLNNKNKKISFLQKILNRPDTVGIIGNLFPILSNYILHSSIFRFIAEKLLGLDRNAPMPKFSGRKFKKFVNKVNFQGNKPNIFYFSGCSVDHYDYEVGISTVKILDILGYNVITETGLCCSLPMLSSGEFDKAKHRSRKTIVNLKKKLDKVNYIVSTSTSCSLTLRKKYSEYLDFTDQDSLKVSKSIKDICEYFLQEHFDYFSKNLNPINFKKVFYHGPCQLKSHSMGLPALEIMRLIPELKIILSEADCCGIGGTYGYDKEKSHISNSIKKNLVEQIKYSKPDLVVCDSETCRWNIEKSTKIKTIHPIQLLIISLETNQKNMNKDIKDKIQSIPIWKNDISIKNLDGGMTNQNFLVQENNVKYVVRLGDDIPEHLISRSNELIVSKAAANAGIGPKVIYQSNGILVLDYIESITLSAEGVRKNIKSIIPIIKNIHNEIPKNLYGQSLIFWVFHVIRNYAKFLKDNQSTHIKILSDLISKSELLEKNSAPYEIVFCHNDLLPANFLDDGSRLWVIDWEYAGYNTPLFDLGGLSSNNNFSLEEEIYLLENYFEKKINNKLMLQYNCLKSASLLRETMWSMVSEITSKIDADYASYTQENLSKFNQAYKELSL